MHAFRFVVKHIQANVCVSRDWGFSKISNSSSDLQSHSGPLTQFDWPQNEFLLDFYFYLVVPFHKHEKVTWPVFDVIVTTKDGCLVALFVLLVRLVRGHYGLLTITAYNSITVPCRPTVTTKKKLSYRRGTARCVVSVEILPIATQQCRNYMYDKSWTNRSYEVGGSVCN